MKECFGNYLSKQCHDHHNCPLESKCMRDTSINKGAYDCQYKARCHIPRQWLATKIKEKNPDYICSFIKYFEEDKNE